MYSFYKFVLLAVIFNSAYFVECSCPDVAAADNFDLSKYASGIWYDVAVYSNNKEFAQDFASLGYSLQGELIKIKSVDVASSDPNYVEGYGKVLSKGKILFVLGPEIPKKSTKVVVTVLALDDDYSVLYGCMEGTDTEIVWVSSRSEKPEGEVKEKIEKYLEAFTNPSTSKSVDFQRRQ